MPTPEPCPSSADPGCVQENGGGSPFGVPGPDDIGAGALDGIADAMRAGLRWFLENTMTWWVKLDSPDLQQEQAIGQLQHLMLPLAAAGTLTGATRPWFKKVTGWMLALIFYKPAAAAVYAAMFTLAGTGNDIRAVLMGFAMMLVSPVAFPVLLKFFTWTTGATETSTGGAFMSALIGGATAVGALRGPASISANDHASFLNDQLGSPGSGMGSPEGARSQPDRPGSAPEDGRSTTPAPGPGQGQPPGPGQSHPLDVQGMPPDTGRPGSGADPDEPVGPIVWQTARNEERRGRDTLRWLNHPTGSGPGGAADSGSEGGSGGSGG